MAIRKTGLNGGPVTLAPWILIEWRGTEVKRSSLILLGGLIAAGVVFASIYVPARHGREQNPHPELAWLKKEYHLNDAQFERVVSLHTAYWPKCGEMCGRIDEKNENLQRLLAATNVVTPEIKAALAEVAQVRIECQAAMLQHFYEVSRVMNPEDGKRYLDWVQEETLLPHQMVPTSPRAKKDH